MSRHGRNIDTSAVTRDCRVCGNPFVTVVRTGFMQKVRNHVGTCDHCHYLKYKARAEAKRLAKMTDLRVLQARQQQRERFKAMFAAMAQREARPVVGKLRCACGRLALTYVRPRGKPIVGFCKVCRTKSA